MNLRQELQARLNYSVSPHRLGAFCDGVLAIAITLLILEFHAPELGTAGAGALTAALLAKWPQYVGYILSFVTIGIYWVNHHYIFHLVAKTNHVFTLLTVALLLALTFLPFPTAVLGSYLGDETHRDEAIRFYLLGLLAPSLVWWLGWRYALGAKLLDPKLDPEFVCCMSRKYSRSVVVYALMFGLAFFSPMAALICAIVLTLAYLVPIPAPIYLP